jgi:hypothetical protein
MIERVMLIAWFGLGVAFQVLYLIRGRWQVSKLGVCLAWGLAGLIPGKHEHVYDGPAHLFLVILFFAATFAIRFKGDLLPAVNEKILLSYSLTLWFALIGYLERGSALQIGLMLVMAPLTVATLYIAFKQTTLNVPWKIVFYTWFLVIVVSLGLMQFSFRQLALFSSRWSVPWVTPLECVSGGMTFAYLAIYATYILYLVPMREEHETWEERMKTWHAFTNLMTQRFDETAPKHKQALVLIAVQGSILALLTLLHGVPKGLVINLMILAPAWIPFFRSTPGPVAMLASNPLPATRNARRRIKNESRSRRE